MPNGTEAISASRGRKCAQTVGWPRTVRHSSAGGINQPSSTTSTRRRGLRMSSHDCRIIPPSASATYCPGIGAHKTSLLRLPDPAARSSGTDLHRGLHRMRASQRDTIGIRTAISGVGRCGLR